MSLFYEQYYSNRYNKVNIVKRNAKQTSLLLKRNRKYLYHTNRITFVAHYNWTLDNIFFCISLHSISFCHKFSKAAKLIGLILCCFTFIWYALKGGDLTTVSSVFSGFSLSNKLIRTLRKFGVQKAFSKLKCCYLKLHKK